jgi:hypothetical protein
MEQVAAPADENLPPTQDVHTDEPAGLFLPAAQLLHREHIDVQDEPSEFAENLPASHVAHPLTAPPLERKPALHAIHPVELAYFPATQISHPEAVTTPLQEEQLDDPSGEFFPEGQLAHVELPELAANVLLKQAVQDPNALIRE